MQMVMTNEKLNLFMKGQDADLDEIYDKFDMGLQPALALDENGSRQ